MKKFIVDRIEGDKAVLECENGDMVNLELKALPKNIKEGDVINWEALTIWLFMILGFSKNFMTLILLFLTVRLEQTVLIFSVIM